MTSNNKVTKVIQIISVLGFAIFCLIFGIIALIEFDKRNVKTIDVSSLCTTSQGEVCSFDITLDKTMSNPVYIYFNYEGWFTSYFIYFKSFLWSDQIDKDVWAEDRKSCYPVKTYQEFQETSSNLGLLITPTDITTGQSSNPNSDVYPCGLKSQVYANLDEMSISDSSSNSVSISTADQYYSGYKDYIKAKSNTWTDVSNGRYVSWMLPSISASGTKFLFGKVKQDMPAGTYTINMTLNLKNSKVNFVPQIILYSDIKVLGNKNLGIIQIISTAQSIIMLATTFILKHKLQRY